MASDAVFLLEEDDVGLTTIFAHGQYHEFTNWTAADGLEAAANKWPAKEAIVFDDVSYTFADWNAKANQVARWAKSIGLKKGDVIAVMMENKPECLFMWTGLAKIGAVAALINNNLRGKPLMHCIKVCVF